MKKILMMFMTFILVFTTLLPSYTAYSEETENYCENMSFSVQTVKVDDEVIEGKAEPESEVKLEIDELEEVAIADDNSEFKFEMEEEFKAGSKIFLTNEQHEIETEVKEVDSAIEMIESELDGECDIPDEVIDENERTEEIEMIEENNNEPAKETTDENNAEITEEETSEISEENEIETSADNLDVETVEDETTDESTEETTDENSGEIDEEKIDELPGENDTIENRSETSTGTVDEETVEDDASNEAVKKTTEGNNEEVNGKKTDKIAEEIISVEDNTEIPTDFIAEEVIEEEFTVENSGESSDEIVEEVNEEETPQKLKENRSKDNTEKELIDGKEKSTIEEESGEISKREMTTDETEKELLEIESKDTIEEDTQGREDDFEIATLMETQQFQVSSIDELLSDTSLEVSHNTNGVQEVITLTYRGIGPLGSSFLRTYYSIFYIPSEIMNLEKGSFEAEYDIPSLNPFTGFRNKGKIRSEEIDTSDDGEFVYFEFSNILNLNYLFRNHYTFTLKITLDELPVNKDGEHFFNAITSDSLDNPITNDNGNPKTLPVSPLPPIINEPIYSTSEKIALTGTGAKNSEIVFRIGEKECRGNIGNDHKFSVEIPSQTADTIIKAFIVKDKDGEIHKSDSIEVTVLKEPDVTAPVINSVNIDGGVKSGYYITGKGEEPGDLVKVSNSTGEDIGEGVIDENGSFSIHIDSADVKVGEELTVQAIDEAGNESDIHTVVVPIFKIVSVPETIVFQNTEITDEEKTIKRENGNYDIKIQDTRSNGDWTLTARAQPLKNERGHTLPDALYYNEKPIKNEAVDVASKSENDEEDIQTISWSDNEGVLLNLNPIEASTDSAYSTTVEWTLTDGP